MIVDGQQMTPHQLAALLDVALKAQEPLMYLDSLVLTFKAMGRSDDSVTTAWIGCLIAEDEIDALMSLRAVWLRGEAACPGKVARSIARSKRAIASEVRELPEDQV